MTRRIAFVVLLTLAVLGCGSEPADDGGASGNGVASLEGSDTTAPEADAGDAALQAEEAMLEFTECLREQGLEVDDPEFDNEGNFRLNIPMGEFMERMNREDSQDAFNACSFLLMGVAQQFGGFDATEMEDRLVEYASCMRENGFDMPDPDFSFANGGPPTAGGEGSGVGPFGNLDTSDPAFEAANDVCIAVFGETIGPGGFGPPTEPGG